MPQSVRQRLNRLLVSDEVVLLFSKELFDELAPTAKRRKFHRYFDTSHVDDLIEVLIEVGVIVEVQSVIEICRDPKDNFLLALAKDGLADYLITGDYGLLDVKKLGKTKIVKLSEFEKMFWE
jgi:putative PIN family toxin of toxin-antitoxin system